MWCKIVLPFLFSFSVLLSSRSVQSRIADIYIYYIYIVCAILYSALKNRSESLTDGNCITGLFKYINPVSLPPPQADEGCHYPSNTFGGCVYGRAKKQSDQNIYQLWHYLYYFNSLEIRAFAVLLPSAS